MNPTSEYSPMPTAKFPTVNAVLDYLRAPSPEEAVSSSTASVPKSNTKAKKTKKEEEPEISVSNGQVLSSGRVRYGPITVNPRKKPSKTLFTGRRSKYEPLTGDEEEKRRLRRERNRVAATKCREKREGVLSKLETVLANESALHDRLLNHISQLKQRQQYLQSVLDGRLPHGPLPQINPTTSPQPPMSTMAYANPHFLANTVDSPATLPPPPPYEQPLVNNVPTLTNSAFESDPSSYFDPHPPQSQILDVTMNSSIERLINSLQSPSGLVDGNNNNFSGLFNSAYGTSTCAQQHSSSSEDDSLPSTRKNRCVF